MDRMVKRGSDDIIMLSERLEEYYVTAGYRCGPVYLEVTADRFRDRWLEPRDKVEREDRYRKKYMDTELLIDDGMFCICRHDGSVMTVSEPDAAFLDLAELDCSPELFIKSRGIEVIYSRRNLTDDLIMFRKFSIKQIERCIKDLPERKRRFLFEDVAVYNKT